MNPPGASHPKARGAAAERLAGAWLRRRGLRPLDANYRCRAGEIDLVMRDGDTLVFVEVRYRRNDRFGSAAESVNRVKQHRIIRAASRYLQQHPRWADEVCRFDVISVSGDAGNPEIEWIRHAFEP